MTTISYRNSSERKEEARVWHCAECPSYHVAVDGTPLTFPAREFEEFAEKVGECYCVELERTPAVHD